MGKLTQAQKNRVREFLTQQGVSFKPLHDEMVDHMSCDLEERMEEGCSFDEAWLQSIGQIPDNHFQFIQNEVMDTISKRFTWSQGLSFFALALLLISTIFKVLHLQFAGELLLLSFAFIAAALITTSVSGIFLNRGKKGATRVLALILGIILLLVGFGFKIMHMPGADELIVLAVALLIISSVVNTLYVHQHASGEGTILTYLHGKYTPALERFLLLLLLPVVAYKAVTLFFETGDFVGNMILLVVICGAGLQLIALSWRAMEQNLLDRNVRIVTATVACCLLLLLPFSGPLLPLWFRFVLVGLFSPIAGWLAYTLEEHSARLASLMLAGLVSVIFLVWALVNLGIVDASARPLIFNLPILVLLVAGIFVSRKHGPMRAYMIVSVAGYVFEYLS